MGIHSDQIEFIGGPFHGMQKISTPTTGLPEKLLVPIDSEKVPCRSSDSPCGYAVYFTIEEHGIRKYQYTGGVVDDINSPLPEPSQMTVQLRRHPTASSCSHDNSTLDKRWLRLEILAEKIYRDLQPGATVTHNDRILGRLTGAKRQIDVSIRAEVAGHDLLIIVDAKDYKRPLDLNDIEQFSGLINDVGASKGVMICNAGFSKKAKVYASKLGIDLCNIFDVQSRDWGQDIRVPVVIDKSSVSIRQYGDIVWSALCSVPNNPNDWKFFENGIPVDPVEDFVIAWNDRRVKKNVEGWHHFEVPCQDLSVQAEIITEGGNQTVRLPLSNYKFEYCVQHKRYLKYCKPDEYRGIKNLSSDKLNVGALCLGVPKEVETSDWQPIESLDVVNVDPGNMILMVEWRLDRSPQGGTVEMPSIK